MKKRLEAELISIAHRILKLKNKSEVDQLYKETQKLYETLSVLKFYQDNFEAVKSEVSEDELDEKLQQSNVVEEAAPEVVEEKVTEVSEEVEAEIEEIQTESEVTEAPAETEETQSEPEVQEEIEAEPETKSEPETKPEEIVEEIVEEAGQNVIQPESVAEVVAAVTEEEVEEIIAEIKPDFEPIFELEAEEENIPAEASPEAKPVKLEDFLGDYKDPVFVKPNEVSLFGSETKEEEKEEIKPEEPKIEEASKPVSEASSKSIAIGLNDRIGFVNHLFNGSNEDFNRVLSQLNTFDTFEEAKTFINEMVIPDYNYWVGEEEYIERFMAIVEKKFQ